MFSPALNGRPMRERDPDTRRSVAAMLDDVEFFADLAVAEYLALLMSAHGDAAPDEHAASLLEEVGLSGAADQLRPACPAVSGGGWRWRRASPGPGCSSCSTSPSSASTPAAAAG